MVRLQKNLSYLAGLADKERKPTQPSQSHPVFLKAPTLNTNIKLRQTQTQDGSDPKMEAPDREETSKYIGELYKKLQALFPDVDPNREPSSIRPSAQGPNTGQTGSQTPGHSSPVPGKQATPTLAASAPPQLMPMGAAAS